MLALILTMAFACDRSSGGAKEGRGKTVKKDENTATGPGAGIETAGLATPEQVMQWALDGELGKVKSALEAGADPNAPDPDGRTALMFAAFNGHSGIVLELLDKGAGVDRRDLMGRTALLYAATGPFPETVRILLDRGAEPSVVDSDEHFSPLMHAAAEGHLEVVKILVEAGADASLKDVDGDDAATFARQNGHPEVENYLAAHSR